MPSKQPSDRLVGCVVFALFGAFLLVAITTLSHVVIEPRQLERQSATWQQTPCEIHQLSVKTHSLRSSNRHSGLVRSSTAYSPKTRFEYTYNGRRYSCERFWFGGTLFSERKQVEGIIAPYQTDRAASCYVNPADPSQAVLSRELYDQHDRGWYWLVAFVMLGGIGCCIALWFVLFGSSYKNRAAMEATSPDAAS